MCDTHSPPAVAEHPVISLRFRTPDIPNCVCRIRWSRCTKLALAVVALAHIVQSCAICLPPLPLHATCVPDLPATTHIARAHRTGGRRMRACSRLKIAFETARHRANEAAETIYNMYRYWTLQYRAPKSERKLAAGCRKNCRLYMLSRQHRRQHNMLKCCDAITLTLHSLLLTCCVDVPARSTPHRFEQNSNIRRRPCSPPPPQLKANEANFN